MLVTQSTLLLILVTTLSCVAAVTSPGVDGVHAELSTTSNPIPTRETAAQPPPNQHIPSDDLEPSPFSKMGSAYTAGYVNAMSDVEMYMHMEMEMQAAMDMDMIRTWRAHHRQQPHVTMEEETQDTDIDTDDNTQEQHKEEESSSFEAQGFKGGFIPPININIGKLPFKKGPFPFKKGPAPFKKGPGFI